MKVLNHKDWYEHEQEILEKQKAKENEEKIRKIELKQLAALKTKYEA